VPACPGRFRAAEFRHQANPIHKSMPTDFLVHLLQSPTIGVSYVVTPQNARALCWMIAHTNGHNTQSHTSTQIH
jgi:hypothetical protein